MKFVVETDAGSQILNESVFVGSGGEGVGGFVTGTVLVFNVDFFGDGGAFFESFYLRGTAYVFDQGITQPLTIEAFIV